MACGFAFDFNKHVIENELSWADMLLVAINHVVAYLNPDSDCLKMTISDSFGEGQRDNVPRLVSLSSSHTNRYIKAAPSFSSSEAAAAAGCMLAVTSAVCRNILSQSEDVLCLTYIWRHSL
jgi:hypothetical protein